jgi:2'-5' RNA ligase
MRPNWFFAFPFDGAFIRQLPPPPPSFRAFPEADVHLTLSFLGACGEAAALRALGALDAALDALPLASFEVSLGDVVPMGPPLRYSALSALLDDGRDAATHRIASLRDFLSDAALARREQRAPKPHVTLARPRRGATGPEREAGLRWAKSLDLRHVRARLDRIGLYTWAEGKRQERLFRIVTERKLAPAQAHR